MLVNPEESHVQKHVEQLSKLPLSGTDLEKIEAYLRGGTESALEGLTKVDLNQISKDAQTEIWKMVQNLVTKKRDMEAARMCNVIYEIGGVNAGVLISEWVMHRIAENPGGYELFSRAKMMAVRAQSMGTNKWLLVRRCFQELKELAQNDMSIIKEAISNFQKDEVNGRLVLYTLYFLVKYPNPKKGLLSEGVLAEDQPLLKDYEEIVVRNLDGLVGGVGISERDLKQYEEMILNGSARLASAKSIRRIRLHEFLCKLLGGCAFVNYRLSPVLGGFVAFCLHAAPDSTLDMMWEMDLRDDLAVRGGSYDDEFGMEPEALIRWAAERAHENKVGGCTGILQIQLHKNKDIYLDYCRRASFEASQRMLKVIEEQDPKSYKEVIRSGRTEQQEKVIKLLVGSRITQNVQEACEYLRGERDLASLYPLEASYAGGMWGGYPQAAALRTYLEMYDEEFYDRGLCFQTLCESWYSIRMLLYANMDCGGTNIDERRVRQAFRGLHKGGMDLGRQLHVLVAVYDSCYRREDKDNLLHIAKSIFTEYLTENRAEMVEAFHNGEAEARNFALLVFGEDAENYKAEILSYTQDSSKLVKETLQKLLQKQPQWKPDVYKLLESKKAAERELAIRVLSAWNDGTDLERMSTLYQTEKNAKVRGLLETVLQIDGGGDKKDAEGALTREDLVKELHKGGKKRSLAWVYETAMPVVHKTNGEPASEEYVQAILLSYVGMGSQLGVSKTAVMLAEDLNAGELAGFMCELFDKWMDAGAESKKKWVLYACAIHGGPEMVRRLHHQIQEWPNAARGAIASEAVAALALSPDPQALLIVDGISRKFKFKQVKAAAGKALEYAASQLGITKEELADRIVPDLGFDERMERKFDYGARSFTVTITTALEIEIFDGSGKKVKNLPAPGQKDDAEKAAASYAEFKLMKKQMKTVVSSQKARLEYALSARREWTKEAWEKLFVANPIMHQFAIGLIWGVYHENELLQSFRYMEDGSFNTEEEDEYTIPEDAKISLVHPIELSKESLDNWKQQLEDYEIAQPLEQLTRPVYVRTQEEMESAALERFGGMVLNDMSLVGKMTTLGWYKGSVQDAGGFYTFYREDAGIGVELHFSGTYVGGMGDDVTVYDARFYKAGAIERGSYCYDEVDKEKAIPLKDIPERYFSEIVYQLAKATASSKEKNEDWKKEAK